jgi:hypothetical protein
MIQWNTPVLGAKPVPLSPNIPGIDISRTVTKGGGERKKKEKEGER